jgi:hypothetical protein
VKRSWSLKSLLGPVEVGAVSTEEIRRGLTTLVVAAVLAAVAGCDAGVDTGAQAAGGDDIRMSTSPLSPAEEVEMLAAEARARESAAAGEQPPPAVEAEAPPAAVTGPAAPSSGSARPAQSTSGAVRSQPRSGPTADPGWVEEQEIPSTAYRVTVPEPFTPPPPPPLLFVNLENKTCQMAPDGRRYLTRFTVVWDDGHRDTGGMELVAEPQVPEIWVNYAGLNWFSVRNPDFVCP